MRHQRAPGRESACASTKPPARSAARARRRAKACKLSLPRVGVRGVGARSPSPRGAESEANSRGGSAPPARRETVRPLPRNTQTASPPAPRQQSARGSINHRHGRRTITATKRTHTQKRRARPSVSLIGLVNPGSYLLSRDLSSDKAHGKAPEGL